MLIGLVNLLQAILDELNVAFRVLDNLAFISPAVQDLAGCLIVALLFFHLGKLSLQLLDPLLSLSGQAFLAKTLLLTLLSNLGLCPSAFRTKFEKVWGSALCT